MFLGFQIGERRSQKQNGENNYFRKGKKLFELSLIIDVHLSN